VQYRNRVILSVQALQINGHPRLKPGMCQAEAFVSAKTTDTISLCCRVALSMQFDETGRGVDSLFAADNVWRQEFWLRHVDPFDRRFLMLAARATLRVCDITM
jgi:hypothetical protein